MERVQKQRTEMFQYLQNFMEETFQKSCEEIQVEIDSDASKIWAELHNVICKCLETAGKLQRQNQKGKLQYLAFSLMQHSLFFGKLELRIDALDDGFYLDTQEVSAHYQADFLQHRYHKDLEYLYKKAEENFIRIQSYELIQIRQTYAVYYYSLLFHMIEALTEMILQTIMESGIDTTDNFKIICGDYMDNAVILYGEDTKDEIFPDRD